MNILQSFAELLTKEKFDEKSEEFSKHGATDSTNCLLFKDVATEDFYLLVKGEDGEEQRVILSDEQAKKILK